MGGKRARAASFQREEHADDPLKRLRAFRARMFDLKPEELAPASASAAATAAVAQSDGIPAVLWKAGKKSKVRSKQRLVEAAAWEDEAVPTVKLAAANGSKQKQPKQKQKQNKQQQKQNKQKQKQEQQKQKDASERDAVAERSNVVLIPGQLTTRAVTASVAPQAPPGVHTAATKRKGKLQRVQNGGPLAKGGIATKPKATASVPAFNDAAAKPFEESVDPLADVMKRIQEKMEAESAKRSKQMAFAAAMSSMKIKAANPGKAKKPKKRKAEAVSTKTGDTAASAVGEVGVAVAVGESSRKTIGQVALAQVKVQLETKKMKTGEATQLEASKSTATEAAGIGGAKPSASTGSAPGHAAAPVPNSPARRKKWKKKQARKFLAHQQQLNQQSVDAKLGSSSTATSALKLDASGEVGRAEEDPTNGVTSATPTAEPDAVPQNSAQQQTEHIHPKNEAPSTSQPKRKATAATAVRVTTGARSKAPSALPDALPKTDSVRVCKPMSSVLKPKHPLALNADNDRPSDSDCGSDSNSCNVHSKRSNLDARQHEASELSGLSDEGEAADESDAASSSSDDDNGDASAVDPELQQHLFSALIDEAARETWELAEVGRLVRLFSSLGWSRRSDATATFLRRYCAELVCAEFLDGLGVTLSSKQLLQIFARGSGKPEVFVNKVASAIENHYLRAKDPEVAEALAQQVDALADTSTRGISEFLGPLLESLSTVRDVGEILRRLCRHWQPERAASLVQHVLLTSVFDDLEGDQDEILQYMPQLKGMLDFPSRMAHEDADADGNLIGLIASEDEGEDKQLDASGSDDDDPEAALGEILSDEEDEDEEDEDEEYEGETDSEEEREAAIRYGPDRGRSRRRSRFILDEASESEEGGGSEDDGEDDE